MAKFYENGIDWADLTAALKDAKKITMADGTDMTIQDLAKEIKGASGLVITIHHLLANKKDGKSTHSEVIRLLESSAKKNAKVIWSALPGKESKIQLLVGQKGKIYTN